MMLAALISWNSLVGVFIEVAIASLIVGLLYWMIGALGIPDPFARFLRGFLIILGVLICINALLALIGHRIVG